MTDRSNLRNIIPQRYDFRGRRDRLRRGHQEFPIVHVWRKEVTRDDILKYSKDHEFFPQTEKRTKLIEISMHLPVQVGKASDLSWFHDESAVSIKRIW